MIPHLHGWSRLTHPLLHLGRSPQRVDLPTAGSSLKTVLGRPLYHHMSQGVVGSWDWAQAVDAADMERAEGRWQSFRRWEAFAHATPLCFQPCQTWRAALLEAAGVQCAWVRATVVNAIFPAGERSQIGYIGTMEENLGEALMDLLKLSHQQVRSFWKPGATKRFERVVAALTRSEAFGGIERTLRDHLEPTGRIVLMTTDLGTLTSATHRFEYGAQLVFRDHQELMFPATVEPPVYGQFAMAIGSIEPATGESRAFMTRTARRGAR